MSTQSSDPTDKPTETHEVECPLCKGAGVTRPWRPQGPIGFVCTECKGEGKVIISFIPFRGRTLLSGIETVKHASVKSGEVSYTDFIGGALPPIETVASPAPIGGELLESETAAPLVPSS